jgi:hypothetical protein
MSRRSSPVLAWVLFALGTAVAIAVAVWNSQMEYTNLTALANAAAALGFAITGCLGLLLALRRPDNVFGWMFLSVFLWGQLLGGVTLYAQWAIGQPVPPPSTDLAIWIVEWAGFPLVGVLALFPLMLFPTGSVIGPGWRWLPPTAAVVIVLWTLGFAFQGSQDVSINGVQVPNPYALTWAEPLINAAPVIFSLPLLGLFCAGIASVVLRFRRGDDAVRAQIKWFALGVVVWASVLFFPGEHGTGGVIDVVVGIAIALVPLTMVLAILRYRLFDIDRIISRTLSYVIVTAVLVTVYAAFVLGVTSLIGSNAQWVVAAATLAAAAMAQPLYRRVQRAIDQRFDRTRYDQLRTVDTFGRTLRTRVQTDQVSASLLATVSGALHPTQASLWIGPTR